MLTCSLHPWSARSSGSQARPPTCERWPGLGAVPPEQKFGKFLQCPFKLMPFKTDGIFHAPIACCERAAHQMGSIREADVAQSGAQFAFDKLRDVQTPRRLPSTFDENETGTEFPNAGRIEFPNALEIPIRRRRFTKQNQCVGSGWGGRDRTSEWRNQNPLPYRLATPQQAEPERARTMRPARPGSDNARSIEAVRPFQQAGIPNFVRNQLPGSVTLCDGAAYAKVPGRFHAPGAAQYRPSES
jgi:hypothetical protein